MMEGAGRDDALFRLVLRFARACPSEDELGRQALAANATMAAPLTANDVLEKAARAWRYKMEGTLMAAGDRAAVIGLADIARCREHPVAFWLLALLRSNHALGHIFAVAPEPMSKTCGHSHNTIRKARDWLVGEGLLTLIRRGRPTGKGRGTPNQYRLAASQI